MTLTTWEEACRFELTFWLQVLGDHARFIHSSLAIEEQEELARSQAYIDAFDRLLHAARHTSDAAAWLQLSQRAYQSAQELRYFKLHLLRRVLEGFIRLQLPQTFLNHMVNEVEEALLVLHSLQAQQTPPLQDPLHHHLLWLQDAYGHSAAVSSELDLTEMRLREKSDTFTMHFQQIYLKAAELAGYTRTGLRQFPALARFHREAELEMVLFREFLQELEELGLTLQLLGTLMPLLADHMAREECYYLTKLSWSAGTADPACDPGKPRVEM